MDLLALCLSKFEIGSTEEESVRKISRRGVPLVKYDMVKYGKIWSNMIKYMVKHGQI